MADISQFSDDIFQCIFLNEIYKFRLWFYCPFDNNPSLVQIMAWRRPGDKPLSGIMMISLLYWRIYGSLDLNESTHICGRMKIHSHVPRFLKFETYWLLKTFPLEDKDPCTLHCQYQAAGGLVHCIPCHVMNSPGILHFQHHRLGKHIKEKRMFADFWKPIMKYDNPVLSMLAREMKTSNSATTFIWDEILLRIHMYIYI